MYVTWPQSNSTLLSSVFIILSLVRNRCTKQRRISIARDQVRHSVYFNTAGIQNITLAGTVVPSTYGSFKVFIITVQKEPTECTICFQFISVINLYTFRADLLLIIRRYNSVYTTIGICHAFILTGCWQDRHSTKTHDIHQLLLIQSCKAASVV
jgi:hypothetical protein